MRSKRKTTCYIVGPKKRQDIPVDEIRKKQNEFLDLYSFYAETGIAWIHDELKLKAYELHLLDPDFKFKVQKGLLAA